MSKDPLEELFGPAGEDTEPVAQPVPARQRLAQEQAERVRTQQLPAERGGSSPRERASARPPALPWIVVGIVAVLAIAASIVTVNLVRGAGAADEAASSTEQSTAPATSEPTAPAPDDDEDEDESPETDPDGPPRVDVGETSTMAIDAWGVTSELSQRFGSTQYAIPDNVNLVLSSSLLDEFPESCADMRAGWGATRAEDGTYSVLRPAETCAEAPELYDEVWGLVAAWVETIQ